MSTVDHKLALYDIDKKNIDFNHSNSLNDNQLNNTEKVNDTARLDQHDNDNIDNSYVFNRIISYNAAQQVICIQLDCNCNCNITIHINTKTLNWQYNQSIDDINNHISTNTDTDAGNDNIIHSCDCNSDEPLYLYNILSDHISSIQSSITRLHQQLQLIQNNIFAHDTDNNNMKSSYNELHESSHLSTHISYHLYKHKTLLYQIRMICNVMQQLKKQHQCVSLLYQYNSGPTTTTQHPLLHSHDNILVSSDLLLGNINNINRHISSISHVHLLYHHIDMARSGRYTTLSTTRLTSYASIIMPCALLACMFHVDVMLPFAAVDGYDIYIPQVNQLIPWFLLIAAAACIAVALTKWLSYKNFISV